GDVTQVLFSRDGSSLFSRSRNQKQSTLIRWGLASGGQERARFLTHVQFLGEPALHPDGRCLAFLGDDGIVLLETEQVRPVWSRAQGQFAEPYCISPNGRFLAAESHHRIVVLELATGRVVRTIQDSELGRAHDRALEHLLFSPDGSLLLSASFIDEDR